MKSVATFWGKVIEGKKRGREMGFPTANTRIHKKIPEGIYASQIKISNSLYNALTFIGSAKTFNEKKVLAESYIFNFQKNIYNTRITITLLKKLRDNKKFDSVEKLILQMEKDKEMGEEFFNTYV